MVLLPGLDKNVSDVLRNNYCHDKPWHIIVNHSSDNPIFSASGMLLPSNEMEAAPSIKYTSKGITVETKATSSGGASYHMAYKVQPPKNWSDSGLLKDLMLGAKFDRVVRDKSTSDTMELYGEVQKNIVHTRISVNPFNKQWGISHCFSSKATEKQHVMVAGMLNGNGADIEKLRPSLGIALVQPGLKSWTIVLKSGQFDGKVLKNVIGSFHASNEKGQTLAAEADYNLATSSTSVTFGGMTYFGDSKQTCARIKVVPSADVIASISHKFSESLTGTFGCKVSGINRTQDVNYGMKLSITT